MSPRKRLRTTIVDDASSGLTVPISQPIATIQPSDVSARSVMAMSPERSATSSIAENTACNSSRYVAFRESKAKTRSWYGSWPRLPKSSASTQLATENIMGGTLRSKAAPDLRRFDPRKPDDSSAAEETHADANAEIQISADVGESYNTEEPPTGSDCDQQVAQTLQENLSPAPTSTTADMVPSVDPVGPVDPVNKQSTNSSQGHNSLATAPTPGWFSWLGRSAPAGTKPQQLQLQPQSQPTTTDLAAEAPIEDGPGKTLESQGGENGNENKGENGDKNRDKSGYDNKDDTQAALDTSIMITPNDSETARRQAASGGMWSYFWYSNPRTAPIETIKDNTKDKAKDEDQGLVQVPVQVQSENRTMQDGQPSNPIPVPRAPSASRAQPDTSSPSAPATASAGTTWAFWSRDARLKTAGKDGSVEQGEIAVIGERSEAHPKPASGVRVKEPVAKASASSLKDVPAREAGGSLRETLSRKKKRLRPLSMDVEDDSPASETSTLKGRGGSSESLVQKNKQAIAAAAAAADNAYATVTAAAAAAAKPPPANLLLPSFRSTYRLKENASIVRQLARLLLRANQTPAKHVFLAKDTPRVQKAVAIGVHGLFPATYLRPMIGQPTGTSIRFASHGAEAVRRWADSHGFKDCEIEKIALEGEGKIAERVDNLWKLLLNWIDHIRNADFIVLACHSQGVPVGMMLLAKLIDLGIVTTARIGVCAMAGVSLGPFPDYKSGLGMLMGSAGELWDFSNPESEVSRRYEHSLKVALEYGVRITYVGSIDDQVVPLESAIYSPAHHPYIYRAVFVDGRIHAPDFIAHLVGFACKLRNLGVSDHGLIRELSVPLAGSLYSGEGHSRLYDEPQIYDLAISHALETADVGKVTCETKKFEGLVNPNPYHLPWILRGLLEEEYVKTELHAETAELVRKFDDWKPNSKALKDVKYRLEAVRSKL